MFGGGEITHEKKDYNLPEDFFDKNIVNVTGIVGKNEAGKSNLKRAINIIIDYFLPKKGKPFKKEEYIVGEFVLIFNNTNIFSTIENIFLMTKKLKLLNSLILIIALSQMFLTI